MGRRHEGGGIWSRQGFDRQSWRRRLLWEWGTVEAARGSRRMKELGVVKAKGRRWGKRLQR